MFLDQTAFINKRPWLYHLTAAANVAAIRRDGRLTTAAASLMAAGRSDLLDKRRPSAVQINIGNERRVIRDQKPLHRGNMALQGEWSFEQFVRRLNEHVFFWPGYDHGPIDAGLRHFGRYSGEEVQILRVPTRRVFELAWARLRVSRFNSGAPRCSRGQKSPRGPSTFTHPSEAAMTPSVVQEVAIYGDLPLPDDAEWATSYGGPWSKQPKQI